MMRAWMAAAALAVGLAAGAEAQTRARAVPQANDPYFVAAAERLARTPMHERRRAKNVILFVGDGMGVTTVTAARIYAGQARGVDGESYELAMDSLPRTGLSHTYSHDFQVADSAATVTAMTSGVKTRSGAINVTSDVPLGDCAAMEGHVARTLFEIAEERGLATGVISTARLTHATPAGVYAHTPHRDWENDTQAKDGCVDIARQLVEWQAGDGLEVALGGGRANFLPTTVADPEYPSVHGVRGDGRDLTAEWAAKPGHAYVWNAEQFAAADFAGEARVLGLFEPSHMQYELNRGRAGEPSVAEMTRAAITRLALDEDGFVLMVEGGRVDHAHHEGKARLALADAVALDDAVRVALEMTSPEDTLIIVTADHSHTLTFAGYARRNAPILGLAGAEEGPAEAADGLPYTTLGYANGPGAVSALPRADLSEADLNDPNFRQQALVPLPAETHGGEDVAIFAGGPGSEGLVGSIPQHVIFHAMARALGWRVR